MRARHYTGEVIHRASILLLAAAALWAQDAREIVRRSLASDQHNWELARQYTFVERNEQRELDGSGGVKSRKSKTFDVTLLEGSPYRRLLAVNDQPLAAEAAAEEQRKLDQSIQERSRESQVQRDARLAEWQRRRQKQRDALNEIPDAFDFRVTGQEHREGRAVWVISATPHRGYKPRSTLARFFPKLTGTLWIDQQDDQWARAEARITDTISLGWILARVAKGSRMSFEQTRVNDEVWLPRRIDISGVARIALVKKLRVESEITYRDYRKFQADSRVLPITPAQ